MFLFDYDVLSYVSFKLCKYDIRNTEVIHAKGRYRTVDVFSFFNRIVDLQNGLHVAIRTIDQLSLFSKKVNQFYILVNWGNLLQFFDHLLLLFVYLVFYVFYIYHWEFICNSESQILY